MLPGIFPANHITTSSLKGISFITIANSSISAKFGSFLANLNNKHSLTLKQELEQQMNGYYM